MILRSFDIKPTAKSTKSDPISYLLSMKDYKGNVRSVKPEVLMGDEFNIRESIKNNPRKGKYTSGVIAFADDENPSTEEINYVCQKFLDTFLPGEAQDRVPYLLVAHRDKGNLEIHYVVAKEWIKDNGVTRSFNMDPPRAYSRLKQQYFQSVMNQDLGYSQINPNPFYIAFSAIDKADKYLQDKISRIDYKQTLRDKITTNILNGKIKNRDDLIAEFRSKNVELTRIGFDYISIKPAGSQKAIKLKGPAFHQDADYSLLIKQYEDYKNNQSSGVYLSPTEYQSQLSKLNALVAKDITYNQKTYSSEPKSRQRSHLYVKGADGKKFIPKKDKPVKTINNSDFKQQNVIVKVKAYDNDNTIKNGHLNTIKMDSTQTTKADSSGSSGSSSIGVSSSGDLDSLLTNLNNLRAMIANEKNPAKVIRLKAKADEIERKIAARRKQMDSKIG